MSELGIVSNNFPYFLNLISKTKIYALISLLYIDSPSLTWAGAKKQKGDSPSTGD